MPETATPPDGEPDEASGAGEETPDVPVFANRAERRAKGKGKSAQPQSQRQGGYPGGRDSVQSQRRWGNRRTG
ncbi:hypothetical protein ACTMTJ_26390 [Phytohabitans sp. LJ34]|uniref:hypothetical protein n=1 Tax=Phytohabitans sp. LJ34 TaxID=3452217 RepID=UPI003F8AE2BF